MKTFKEGWFLTFHKKEFCLFAPTLDMIDARDILHSLSHINRFNGHTYRPYSVLEHTLRAVELAKNMNFSTTVQQEIMVHDFAEAYYQDLMSPLKDMLGLDYTAYEKECQSLINFRFLGQHHHTFESTVKSVDRIMMIAEARDIAQHVRWWPENEEPNFTIPDCPYLPFYWRCKAVLELRRLFGDAACKTLSRVSVP